MKKTYQLQIEGKNRDRLLDAVKHDIRRYFKRERAKALPAGAELWQFDCRCGLSIDDAAKLTAGELPGAVDRLAEGGAASIYVEVMAKPAQRPPKPLHDVDHPVGAPDTTG